MELGILAGVSAIGYLLNQREKDQNFDTQNQLTLPGYLGQHPYQQQLAQNHEMGYQNSCADSYPLNANPEYIKHQQRMLSGLPKRTQTRPNPKTDDQNTRNVLQIGQDEGFSNFIPANDPTSDLLLDLKERPLTDFYHNNMVPFYGSKVTQNMAGTGVASGSYIDGSTVPGNITGINSGFDYSTPMQTTLASFTGIDDTYLHKREVGPMFSPAEQQTGWVYGMPLFRPDMDRYTQSLSQFKNDLSPVEPEQVGPGLNTDPSIPAQGGFHDFTRILPNNVNDYKKNQLPGRVNAGKYFSAGLPESYPGIGVAGDTSSPGITKNKPNSFWDQTRYPVMTTKVGFQQNLDYNIPEIQVTFKPNNATRDQTSYGLGNLEYKNVQNKYISEGFANTGGNRDQILCVNEEVSVGQGPLAAHVPQTGQRSETYMSQDNNIRSRNDCNAQPIGNPQRAAYGHGNIVANWYVNETDRGTVNPQNVMQLNLNTQVKNGSFWTAQDEPGTTRKETTDYAYSGNVSREDLGSKFWTFQDENKTTRAETTNYAFAGNVSREDLGSKFWTFQDEPGTTRKETNNYAYSGDVQRLIPADMNRSQFTGFDISVP